MFRDDLDTFCKYLAHRPPNIDRTVHQHLEDRHLEKAMRGLYYVARYDHRPDDGEAMSVQLDQYCGRIDLDDEVSIEAGATARKADEINERVREAVAQVGGTVCHGAITYTGELLPRPDAQTGAY